MHRLIVALLATVDAAIAVAVGIVATLAPLTLLWVFEFGGTADWGALWPASAIIWQFGNLVPVGVTLPGDYLAVAGIDRAAASFTLSLAPLAFAAFTVIFAARSGVRAARADAWITGVLIGTAVFAALASAVAVTSESGVAEVAVWQAVLYPSLLFALPALMAAVVTEWCEAGAGVIARVRDRIEAMPHGWGAAPGLVTRGAAVVVVGLIGLGALVTAVSLALHGTEVIALYESAHLDVLGVTVLTLAQLAYLPTIVVWALAFVAGPGFAVGEGTSVSPAGTQVGVVPGIPILGIIPESTTPWLLLLALAPVALGALAGWIARSRLVGAGAPRTAVPRGARPDAARDVPASATVSTDAATDAARTSALAGLLAQSAASRDAEPPAEPGALGQPEEPGGSKGLDRLEAEDPIGARLVVALGIAVLGGGAAALLAAFASGSIGPGTLATMGPEPGPVALAVGLEVIVGAGILLLAPRARRRAADAGGAAGDRAGADDVSGDRAGADGAATETVRLDTAPDPAAAPHAPAPPDPAPDPAVPDASPVAPREPFSFPTLPRIPPSPPDPGDDGARR